MQKEKVSGQIGAAADPSSISRNYQTSKAQPATKVVLKRNPQPSSTQRSGRKPGKIVSCPHVDLKHFAKGMCNHCYHRFGRKGQATECEHKDRMNYAKGKCQNCYINDYNRRKREQAYKKLKEQNSELDQAAQNIYNRFVAPNKKRDEKAAGKLAQEDQRL